MTHSDACAAGQTQKIVVGVVITENGKAVCDAPGAASDTFLLAMIDPSCTVKWELSDEAKSPILPFLKTDGDAFGLCRARGDAVQSAPQASPLPCISTRTLFLNILSLHHKCALGALPLHICVDAVLCVLPFSNGCD